MRLSHQPQKPAEKNAVRPVRNCDLIACDESDCGTDAMDGGSIRQILAQVKAELLLRAATYGDDHLCRATILNQRN
jgi:hypothetical protein